MSVINYFIEGRLVFARQTRDEIDDPQFPWPERAFRLMSNTYVMSERLWREIIFPRVGFRYETLFDRPSWIVTTRSLWIRWAEDNGLLALEKPLKPRVTIKYDAVELFTALCGDVGLVKKVVR